MKQFFACGLVVAFIAGCGPKPSDNNPEANEPAANVPVVTPGANNEVPPGSTPPQAKPQPGANPPQNNRTPMVSPGAQHLNAAPQQPASMPPRENPNAGPPKPGEQVAADYKIQMGNQTIEVEGVCKLTEDEAICWRPNGDKNESLATELTNAIKSKNDTYSNQFQFKFMKKNRILVMKTTTPPTKPGQGYSGSYGGSVMSEYGGGPEFMEGWTNNGNMFGSTSSTGFDQTRIERQVLTGVFNKETKSFPLRYQSTTSKQDREVIPFQKGQFTIDGNSYEITSISDKPAGNSPNMAYMGGNPRNPNIKTTFITIQVVNIKNPYSIVSLTPADDSGNAYGGLDEKGNPISMAEYQKQQMAEQQKMMEASRSGKPYQPRSMDYMNRYIGGMSLDPMYFQRNSRGRMTQTLNVEASKIKKLVANKSSRTVYVFDKIRLDQN